MTQDQAAPHRTQRADELDDLYTSIKDLIVPFVRVADQGCGSSSSSSTIHQDKPHRPDQQDPHPQSTLVQRHSPQDLIAALSLTLPEQGQGKAGLVAAAKRILDLSVNTWHQGFLDKLYAATSPPGLAAEMLLSALNTNSHVYAVSPALTAVEKQTAAALARLFGLNGNWSGGVSQPGGSAANLTSLVVARNALFPETKTDGYAGRKFVMFTSVHGHYSLEKAAQICGFGSGAVRSVPVDEKGCMRPEELERLIVQSKESEGETPFYVNATAGTTVLGSFDPLDEIAEICRRHGLWMHVDGSWGGPVVFSEKQRWKLSGVDKADSVAICPHKMMGVPLTCSFLLGRDLRQFHRAMTLPAGYLFHNPEEEENGVGHDENHALPTEDLDIRPNAVTQCDADFWDLADLTPQCGRRGDSLKLALTWTYYGSSGIAAYIDHGFDMAAHLASLVAASDKFSLVSENPPPCLQVCFYFNKQSGVGHRERNSRITEQTSKALVPRGFMVDFAPGNDGKFFRVVVNGQTRKETLDELVAAIDDVGQKVILN